MGEQVDRRWIILGFFAVVAAAIVVVILVSRGGGSSSSSSESTTTGKVGKNGCEKVAAPKPRKVSLPEPKQNVEKGETVTAVVETSCGDFDIALDTTRAPKTTNSFAYLADEGVYEGTQFGRVVPGFVIQGGDPEETGAGGPGYNIEEAPPANLAYTKGVVAMAKGATDPPGFSGSQFFVVLGAKVKLPPEYALIGKVSSGMKVVETIGSLGTSEEKPKQVVLIKNITIERG
ncbi:MAG TPA: peptidylprolyl isomerase [Solirubrobacterales bacterium]|jgi:peptidyl-prolyl cis-trans isomerase B (cyclophilin B)